MPDVPLFYPGLSYHNNILRNRLRLRQMTDDDLIRTWDALWLHTNGNFDDYNGMTFTEWSEEVYSELCRRENAKKEEK